MRNHLLPVLFAFVVILAALNRETGMAIPALFAAWTWTHARTRRNLALSLVYVALGVGTVLLVRVVQGTATTYWTLDKVAEANLVTYPYGALMPLLAFGAWWVYVWRARRGRFAPLLAVAGAYMAGLLLFGIHRESRLLLPMLPILALAATTHFNRKTIQGKP